MLIHVTIIRLFLKVKYRHDLTKVAKNIFYENIFYENKLNSLGAYCNSQEKTMFGGSI